MKNNKANGKAKESRELALHYMEALVDVARESFLILDPNLRVVMANQIFYQNFQVSKGATESQLIYELGNGQWNIPELKDFLEDILPNKKAMRDYEVRHVFETIGEKTMVLNARQIDSVQLIILAIEDVTDKKNLEEKLAECAKGLEVKVAERTHDIATRVKELEALNKTMVGRELKMVELKKEIADLKKRVQNGNGKNGNGKNHNGNHKNGR
ncbi:MAG TPA: hypothetical protein DEP11_04350 [Candidatus Jacksonbacteria bacterium]|nr:hypothetical protein [Candidatus Jacksonbacteria bacterium]